MFSRKLAMSLVCGSLLLGGCTGYNTQSGAVSGAAAGATLGLISGMTTNDSVNGTLWRVAGGALIGGVIGDSVEKSGARR